MAMYYQGSSEPDHVQIQTLHLMNPNSIITLSDDPQNQHRDNTLLFNPAAMAHQQFVGFTLPNDSNSPSLLHQDQEDHAPNIIPRLYNPSTLELLAYHGNQTNMSQWRLSLSLPPHKLDDTEALQKSNMDYPNGRDLPENSACNNSPDHTLAAAAGFSYPVQGVILGSKYLKAAQELLDEVVSVGNKGPKIIGDIRDKAKNVRVKQPPSDDYETGAANLELTTTQRQEMQVKKDKLNSMLDEVDQRCRSYRQQMQITISLFEREAGIGSSRPYTQLALKTILKQFKRLKSAIISQIKSINKSLGDEHGSGETFEGPRLKFIDHELRQRRSSPQQLAMMQGNAWSRQRGLPEKAVSVLRAWLFEHFLHPYPKDSDKSKMAKQAGLTRNQVSNWFINARVRLWKPMVEEMYLEEMKNQVNDHKDSSSSSPPPLPPSDNNIKQSHHRHNENPISSSLLPSPAAEISASSITPPSPASGLLIPQFSSSSSNDPMRLLLPEKINNLERPRNYTIEKNQENSRSSILSSVEVDIKDHTNTTIRNEQKGFPGNHCHGYYLPTPNTNADHHRGNFYGNYGIGELSRFNTEQIHQANSNSNNGHFSLSLAPPPPSGNYAHEGNFHQIGTRVEHGVMNDDDGSSHPNFAVNYEDLLDFYKRRRYLPDFVA